MGLAKHLLRVFVDTTVILGVILFIPGFPPYSSLEPFIAPPPLPFEGALDPKDYALAKAEKLFEGEIVGPECFEVSPVEPDVFYTTLQGGAIVKISENGKKMKAVAKFGEKCEGNWDGKNCGRPLGIHFNSKGQLIAADSYLGIYQIDFESGQVLNLVNKDTEVDGKLAKTFNSVAPARNGKIYYTVSSTNYHLDESVGEMLGAPSGRLIVFDPETNENKVLLENLHFPNGIVLSPDEDYLIFAECLRYRLHKYYIRGPKAGTSEVFLDGIPGSPDNLNLSPDGNIFVALVTVRLPGEFNPLEFMYSQPLLRKLAVRLLHVLKFPFDFAAKYVDLPILRKIASHIMNFETLLPVLPPYSVILEVDWNGKIINSWHSNLSDVRFFSDAKIINGYMYLGSPYNDYIGRIKMPDSIHFVKQPVFSLG
ncbi:adipocyte plasma membrane-associated protein Hemomucin-like [Daphnia carinata]|uniref:adipocyte plasma membrane-associated protein Hemomucin-like n=1 Tax=Daphnia carinata TaxID=120202 RepID=UPI00257D0311|nr:adipocyte plasma membrane-associated protein Hemomucin-like [Daphnia carinata]